MFGVNDLIRSVIDRCAGLVGANADEVERHGVVDILAAVNGDPGLAAVNFIVGQRGLRVVLRHISAGVFVPILEIDSVVAVDLLRPAEECISIGLAFVRRCREGGGLVAVVLINEVRVAGGLSAVLISNGIFRRLVVLDAINRAEGGVALQNSSGIRLTDQLAIFALMIVARVIILLRVHNFPVVELIFIRAVAGAGRVDVGGIGRCSRCSRIVCFLIILANRRGFQHRAVVVDIGDVDVLRPPCGVPSLIGIVQVRTVRQISCVPAGAGGRLCCCIADRFLRIIHCNKLMTDPLSGRRNRLAGVGCTVAVVGCKAAGAQRFAAVCVKRISILRVNNFELLRIGGFCYAVKAKCSVYRKLFFIGIARHLCIIRHRWFPIISSICCRLFWNRNTRV